MINYSIIIPHKNSAELLEYCLATIPVRDDVQVIVVDDNSEQKKVDFAHFPQWAGKNYEYYFTKEGKGAGYARNVGLEHAKGKWILFVDADDFLLPIIDGIFDECVNSDADLIYFRPQAVMLEDRETYSTRADAYNNIIDEYLATGDETKLRVRFFSPTCKIIKRELVEENHIRFDEIKYSNDVLFAVKIGCAAKKIQVSEQSYYMITECKNSLRANFNKKKGEVEIRGDAFFRASEIIVQNCYSFNKQEGYSYLTLLLLQNKKLFAKYFRWTKQIMKRSTLELLYEMFKANRIKSKIKRISYAIYVLTFN